MIVVQEADLPSNGGVFWRGFITGVVLLIYSFVIVGLVAAASTLVNQSWILDYCLVACAPLLLVLAPIALLIIDQDMIARPKGVRVAALGYALGLMFLPICGVVPLLLIADVPFAFALLATATFGAGLYALFGWAAGVVFFRYFGRVVFQDGTLCSNCGYDLTGNVSGVCPECGTGVETRADRRA